MSIERKVAVITGASQGIGAALVKAYRARNYRVIATARSIKPSNDADILVIPGDITDRKTAERAICEGVARFGRIDTLVNNAGISQSRSPSTLRPTMPPSWVSISPGSSTRPSSPSPRWRSRAAAISCRSRRA